LAQSVTDKKIEKIIRQFGYFHVSVTSLDRILVRLAQSVTDKKVENAL
jgi:bacterioferritin-associated ferredoxin